MYEQLLELRLNKFRPFRLILKDGRRFAVRDQLGFSLSPGKTAMAVALPKAGFAQFKIDQIEKIIVSAPRKSKRKAVRAT